ncbi:MAG: hypothetical protein ACRYHA_07570 [Janthinobacterium lividum]
MPKQVDVYYDGRDEHWRWGTLLSSNAITERSLILTEASEGGYRLTAYDPDFEQQMKLAEEIMHDDHDILRALAK